jgi:hypothetical protein
MTTEQPVRLAISPAVGRGRLDGAWWPATDDLAVELPYLVEHLPASLGRVTRVVYSRAGWKTAPRRITLSAERSVRVAPFAGVNTHRMLVQMGRGLIAQILVVPPQTGAAEAADMIHDAADPDNRQSAAELVGTANPETPAAGGR